MPALWSLMVLQMVVPCSVFINSNVTLPCAVVLFCVDFGVLNWIWIPDWGCLALSFLSALLHNNKGHWQAVGRGNVTISVTFCHVVSDTLEAPREVGFVLSPQDDGWVVFSYG